MQSERWNEASLEQLPVELQVLILEKLTQRDRVTCRRVHSRLRSAFDRCRLLDLVVAPSLPRNACGEPQQCRHCGGGGSERKTGCRLLQCRIADLADTICAAADAAPRWPEEAVPAPAEPEMATPVAAAAAALQGPRHLELRALEALLSHFQGKVQLQLHLASRQWKEGWAQTLLWAVAGRVTEVRFGEEAVGIAQQHSRLDARLLQSLLMRCTKLQRISVGPVEPRLLGSRPTTGAKRALEADAEPGQREGEDVDTETLFMVESWWSNQRGQAGSDAALLDTAAAKTLGWHEMVVGMLPALCRSCRSLQRLAIELKPGARGGVRLPELPGHIDLRLDLGNCHIQGHEEAAAEAPTGSLASLTASMNALAGIQQRHLGCLRHLQLHQACWQSGALPSLLHDRLPGTCQCLSSLELSLTTGSHRLYEHLLPRELWQVLPEPRLPVAGEAHVHRWRAGKELSLHRLSALTRLAIHLDPSIDTALHGPPPELEPLLPRPPPPPHPHPHPHPPAPPAAGVVCISSLPPGLRELSLNGVALTPQLAASLPPVLQRVTLCSWPVAAADDSRAQLCLRIPEEVQELRLSADHASRIDMPPQLRSLSIAPHPASAGNASAWLDVDRLLQAAPTALRHLAIRMPAASAAASQVDLSRFRQLQCLLLDRCASQPDRHAAPDAAPPDDAAAAPASCPLPAVAAPSYDSPRPSPEVLLPRGGLQQLVVVGDLHLAFADPPAPCWPPPASAPPLRSPPLPDAAAGAGAQRCALGSVVEIQTLTICNAERPLCAAQRLPPLLYRLGMERWRQQGVRVAELQVFVQAGSASAAPLLPQWAAAVVRRLQLLPVPYPAPGAVRAELPGVACKSVNALFT